MTLQLYCLTLLTG